MRTRKKIQVDDVLVLQVIVKVEAQHDGIVDAVT